ncbi:putative metallopeptidase [Cloacibacillus porcorum]|uniref:putative metallopeptidase n=1 Tax=Cloacibacillus porcorum TaxID=1197717 RepID=UPI003D0574E3
MSDAEFNYKIASPTIRDTAVSLVQKYDELKHLDPDNILFVVNFSTRDKKKRLAKTSRVPVKWQEILYQKGSCSYWYMVEFFARTVNDLSAPQVTALMYRELRKIDPSVEICEPDTVDWYDLISCLGKSWADPTRSCIDLLAEDTPKTIFTGRRPVSDD